MILQLLRIELGLLLVRQKRMREDLHHNAAKELQPEIDYYKQLIEQEEIRVEITKEDINVLYTKFDSTIFSEERLDIFNNFLKNHGLK